MVGYSQDTNVVFDGINASVTNEPACYTSPSGIFDSTKCTANDVSFGDVYLGDHLGVLATPAYAQNPINGLFIWVKVASNSGKYDLYTQFDYLVGGVRKNFDNTPFIGGVNDRLSIRLRGTIITANSKYRLAEITNYVFGQSLELKKIYVGWESYGQSLNGRPLSGITCSGPHCTPAFYGGIIIQTPLYPDFTVVKSCDGGAFEKVVFTNTSTGGNANNTYTWLFPGALSVSPSTNPYTNFGPYTVTYASGGSKSFTLSMSNPSNLFIPNSKAGTVTVAACCNLSITNITSTNVSCFGGNNGTVTATISGAAGTAVYNLLYSVTSGGTYTNAAATNGDANGIYTGLSKGFYKVNVVDGNSCNVTSSYVEVTQPAAAVTVSGTQTNVLCNGASTGAID
ncbi:MAG: SprB repeat-containing protein, partial [Lutibacter sp.]